MSDAGWRVTATQAVECRSPGLVSSTLRRQNCAHSWFPTSDFPDVSSGQEVGQKIVTSLPAVCAFLRWPHSRQTASQVILALLVFGEKVHLIKRDHL